MSLTCFLSIIFKSTKPNSTGKKICPCQGIRQANYFLHGAQADVLTGFYLPQTEAGLKTQAQDFT